MTRNAPPAAERASARRAMATAALIVIILATASGVQERERSNLGMKGIDYRDKVSHLAQNQTPI